MSLLHDSFPNRSQGSQVITKALSGHKSSPSVDAYPDSYKFTLLPEPASLDVTKDLRLHRTNVNGTSAVNKHIIRGSMAKVVNSNGTPFSRMIA